MKKAGRQELGPDTTISDEALGHLADMVRESSKAINVAADAVLDFQSPHADKMGAAIKKAVDAGEPVPYQLLPRGILPKRLPYDLFVTSSYKGSVYLLTIPASAESMELVDKQRMAEELRLDAYSSFVSSLKQ